jgi:hypothetical protein
MARKSVRVIELKPDNNAQPVISAGGDTSGGDGGDHNAIGSDAGTVNGFPAIEPAAEFIDAGTDPGTASAASEPQRRKRGRPAGSTAATKASKPRNIATGIEKMLFSIHMIGAGLFSTPELVLTPDETEAYAAAVADVASYYNAAIDPRTLAWVNLVMVAGGLYGSRMVAIHHRLKSERKDNVVPFPSPGQSPAPAPTPAPAAKQNQGVRTPADLFGLNGGGTLSEALGD